MTKAAVLEYAAPPRSRIYYGWVNVCVAALAMVGTLPGRTQGLGLITEPLLRDLHIDHVHFATLNVWSTLVGASFCLACGPLIDRFGVRVILTIVAGALGATVIAMSRVIGPTGLLVTMTLTRGFGQSALSVVSITIVGKWFSRRLPIAMGVYSLLLGIGFIAAFPGVFFAVTKYNWRVVWAAIGWVLIAGLMPLGLLLVRRTPESVGLRVDGLEARDVTPDPSPQSGHTLRQALLTPAFWAFALSGSIYLLISSGLMLFNEAVLREHGFGPTTIMAVLGVITLAGLLANFGGGWIAQKWPIGRLMGGAMFLLAAALAALPLASGRAIVYAYAIAMGTSGGIVTVVFFLCWGKLFGRRHLGSIQGMAQLLTVLASAAGPLLLAESIRRTGSSTPLLFALAPVVAILAICCLAAPTPGGSDDSDTLGE